MSGDGWAVGDLALCVAAPDHSVLGLKNPCKPGGIYQVERVVVCSEGLGLGFHGITFPRCKQNAARAEHYRRIPPHTPDAEDRETIRLLQRAAVEA